MTTIILLMAGLGKRLNEGKNKMLVDIKNKPIYQYTLEAFEKTNCEILLVVGKADYEFFKLLNLKYKLVLGGTTRQESVLNALKEVKTERVIIHDGARPFISQELIDKCINNNYESFFVAIRPKNTIRFDFSKDYDTLDRSKLLEVQTPQGGLTKIFLDRAKYIFDNNIEVTDDISMLSTKQRENTVVIDGEENNIKITTRNDLKLAEFILKDVNKMRIGHSWDTHKLVEGRDLILGGVKVEGSGVGLLGHSDADVVLHAVAESFLGALGLGDLGTFYPDNSDLTLNMDSKIILKECYQRVVDSGYKLVNLDLTIYSEYIKISPIRERIRNSIANILNTNPQNVNVKATTYEKMSFIGRGEALACECVCLIDNI